MKKRIKILILCITINILIFCSNCYGINVIKPETSSNVTNNVENNITNNVINYENITIKDLETCVINTAKILESSSIGVELKATHRTLVNGNYIVSEDTESIGSGVIYKRIENYDDENKLESYTYYAFTNRHVILGNNSEYTYNVYAYLGNEDVEIKANVLGYDQKVDMAVITFEHTTLIQPVEIADSDEISNGQFVIAIGNPNGFEYYGSVTFGVISGKLRYVPEDLDNDGVNDFNATFIQHDAAINSGNSGGGLYTIDGKLIGINTMKLVDSKTDNMGFAVPSNVLKSIAENYIEKGLEIIRPRLGVTTIPVNELTNYLIAQNNLKPIPSIYSGKKYGLYVTDISPNSSISSSKIQKDDILLEFGGEKLYNSTILSAKLNSLSDYFVGSVVDITYFSRSQNKIVSESITLK